MNTLATMNRWRRELLIVSPLLVMLLVCFVLTRKDGPGPLYNGHSIHYWLYETSLIQSDDRYGELRNLGYVALPHLADEMITGGSPIYASAWIKFPVAVRKFFPVPPKYNPRRDLAQYHARLLSEQILSDLRAPDFTDKEAEATVEKLSKTEAYPLCIQATAALWNINKDPAKILPLVQKHLAGAPGANQFLALELVRTIGPAAEPLLPQLVPMLTNTNSKTAEAAVTTIAAIGKKTHGVMAAIQSLTNGAPSILRFKAEHALEILQKENPSPPTGNEGPK